MYGHAMASDGSRVFVLGGQLSDITDETTFIHILDTSTYFLFVISFVEFENAEHIKYPNPVPNDVKLSEETTQLARKSSARHPAQKEDSDSEGSAENRAKFAVHDSSFEGDVQLKIERQLSAPLAAQSGRDQRPKQVTDEVREHTDQLRAQMEQKDAELVDMRAKLEKSLLSHRSCDQQVRALEQALQKATSRTAEANERSQRAYEQIGKYETELAAVRLRLTDAENGWAKSKREADALRARTTAGLASTNEDRNTRWSLQRDRAMDAESASLWSNDKNSEVIQFRNEG
jgi:hypothetical protein